VRDGEHADEEVLQEHIFINDLMLVLGGFIREQCNLVIQQQSPPVQKGGYSGTTKLEKHARTLALVKMSMLNPKPKKLSQKRATAMPILRMA
jgi:hypothetical protein